MPSLRHKKRLTTMWQVFWLVLIWFVFPWNFFETQRLLWLAMLPLRPQ